MLICSLIIYVQCWKSGKLKYQQLPTNLLPEHSNAQLPILLYIPEAKKKTALLPSRVWALSPE